MEDFGVTTSLGAIEFQGEMIGSPFWMDFELFAASFGQEELLPGSLRNV